MFQTRNEEGDLKLFDTLQKAFEEAESDATVWKISCEGVRLVKMDTGECICWHFDPIEKYINEIINEDHELLK
jgi:hypothetical protein